LRTALDSEDGEELMQEQKTLKNNGEQKLREKMENRLLFGLHHCDMKKKRVKLRRKKKIKIPHFIHS